VNTYGHALVTAALTEERTPDLTQVAVAGAVMPDLPYLLKGLSIMIRYGRMPRPEELDYYAETNWWVDLLLHSVFPPAIMAAMAKDRRLRTFALAWLAHVLIDFFVHHTDARPLGWPIIMARFHSPVSLSEDKHHGHTAFRAEAALCAALAGSIVRSRLRRRGNH
jgi:hypothetical protein